MLHGDLGEYYRSGLLGIVIPERQKTSVWASPLHLPYDLPFPVHLIVFRLLHPLLLHYVQNSLGILHRLGEHLLPVGRHTLGVESVVLLAHAALVRVHHQALPEVLVHCNEHGDVPLSHPEPPGVPVGCHQGVIILHRGEVLALAVQVPH